MIPTTRPHAILVALGAALVLACTSTEGKRVGIPERPAQTLEAIAKRDPTERARRLERRARDRAAGGDRARHTGAPFPPATAPVRRGECGIPLATSVEGLMRRGGVERVQSRLAEEGMLTQDGYRRGELDEPTLAAVTRLQRRAGLPEVGLPTYATVRALRLELDEVFAAARTRCPRAQG